MGLDGVDTDYTAGINLFEMDDVGLLATLNYDDGSPQGSIANTSFNLTSTFVSGMHFEGGTLQLLDELSNVLLSGNVIDVDFDEALGYLIGTGSAQVTESNIAGFSVGPAGIISLTFDLDPAFTDFDQDYTGQSKVNLVPEPGTLCLLGLGGLGLLRRRKNA